MTRAAGGLAARYWQSGYWNPGLLSPEAVSIGGYPGGRRVLWKEDRGTATLGVGVAGDPKREQSGEEEEGLGGVSGQGMGP